MQLILLGNTPTIWLLLITTQEPSPAAKLNQDVGLPFRLTKQLSAPHGPLSDSSLMSHQAHHAYVHWKERESSVEQAPDLSPHLIGERQCVYVRSCLAVQDFGTFVTDFAVHYANVVKEFRCFLTIFDISIRT